MPRAFPGKIILYLVFMLMLDVTVMPAFFTGLFRPIFLYLWVPYVAFKWNWRYSVPMAFVAGILRDFTTVQPLGVETVVLVSCAIGLALFTQKIERESLLMQMFVVFSFVFLVLSTILILSGFLVSGHPVGSYGILVSLTAAFSSAVIAPVYFALTEWWFQGRSGLKQYELFG